MPITNDRRQQIEDLILRNLIAELLSHGFFLSVHDGESRTVSRSTDADTIFKALKTTDDDYLLVYRTRNASCLGVVSLVYGNDGLDVISDNGTALEPFLTGTTAFAGSFEYEVYGPVDGWDGLMDIQIASPDLFVGNVLDRIAAEIKACNDETRYTSLVAALFLVQDRYRTVHTVASDEDLAAERKAALTPEENDAWEAAFADVVISQGVTDEVADRVAWEAVQAQFPRLRTFNGCTATTA